MIKVLKLNQCDLQLVNSLNQPTTANDKFILKIETGDTFEENEVNFQYFDSPIITVSLDSNNLVEVPKEVIGAPCFKVWLRVKQGLKIRQTNVVEIPCVNTSAFIEV